MLYKSLDPDVDPQVSAKVVPNAQEETPQFVPFTGSGTRLDGKKPNAKQRAEVVLHTCGFFFLSLKVLPSIVLHTC